MGTTLRPITEEAVFSLTMISFLLPIPHVVKRFWNNDPIGACRTKHKILPWLSRVGIAHQLWDNAGKQCRLI